MRNKRAHVEQVFKILQNSPGVLTAKILTGEEKKTILDVEKLVEKKIVFGMCQSVNRGVRDVMQREYSVAIVIQTSDFQYPQQPSMRLIW